MVAIATKFEVDSGDKVATIRFATTVELTAIAKVPKKCKDNSPNVVKNEDFGKSRLEKYNKYRKSRLEKSPRGTNCPYEEIFPKLGKNCSEHTWLVPLRQQNAQACTFLRLKTCTSRKIFVPLQSQRILELWQEANVFINH